MACASDFNKLMLVKFDGVLHYAYTRIRVDAAQMSRSHGRHAKGVPADMGSEVLHLL